MKRDVPFVNSATQMEPTTNLSVLINGESGLVFYPQKDIRQSCPLSPYLFIIAINELSICLQRHSTNHNIKGNALGPNSPTCSSFCR